MENTAALINELFLLAVVMVPVWAYLDLARPSHYTISLVNMYSVYVCMYTQNMYVCTGRDEMS